MANLPETPQWEDGIYQIEVSDPVLGGPDGISNRQAKQLASRTSYLKQQVEKGSSDLSEHIKAADPHTQYAPKASPTFTGNPAAPTVVKTDNSTKLANTAHVKTVVADYAPLASPALTGTPTAPTAPQTVNNTQIATTAFVKSALAALVASSPEALDTLNELAAALGNDPNFATTMTNALAGKQPLDNTLTALSGKSVAALLEYLGLPELLDKKFDKTGGAITTTSKAIDIITEAKNAGYIQISDSTGNIIHQLGKISSDNDLSLRNVAEDGTLTVSGDGARFNGRLLGFINEALYSGNGWWRDGSTGLLIQWGETPAGSDTRQVKFPIPFKSWPHVVVHFDGGWFDSGGATWGVVDKSLSGFTGKTSVAVEGGAFIAIGF